MTKIATTKNHEKSVAISSAVTHVKSGANADDGFSAWYSVRDQVVVIAAATLMHLSCPCAQKCRAVIERADDADALRVALRGNVPELAAVHGADSDDDDGDDDDDDETHTGRSSKRGQAAQLHRRGPGAVVKFIDEGGEDKRVRALLNDAWSRSILFTPCRPRVMHLCCCVLLCLPVAAAFNLADSGGKTRPHQLPEGVVGFRGGHQHAVPCIHVHRHSHGRILWEAGMPAVPAAARR